MPRRTAVCRPVSHRGIYSRSTLETSTCAMGSKNSAYAGTGGAHRLAWRPDSIVLVMKCRESLQRGFPVLVFVGVDLAVLELRALLCPQLDRHLVGPQALRRPRDRHRLPRRQRPRHTARAHRREQRQPPHWLPHADPAPRGPQPRPPGHGARAVGALLILRIFAIPNLE